MPSLNTGFYCLRLCAFVLSSAIAILPTTAIAGEQNPQATAAVRAVNLNADLLNRVSAAALDASAALRDKDSVMSLTDDQDQARTVEALVAEVDASPEAQTALARHHLSSRQFVLTTLALINGYAAALGMQVTHTLDARTGATIEQARFCQQHMAQIKKMFSDS